MAQSLCKTLGMKSIILSFLVCSSISCFGQEISPPSDTTLIETDGVYTEQHIIIGERDPEAQFPGGTPALFQHIQNEFDWDCINVTDSLIERSRVYLSFIVEENGSISNVSIDRGINQFIDQCCIDFIQKMPKWNPATNRNGKPIAQRVRLPITICLN